MPKQLTIGKIVNIGRQGKVTTLEKDLSKYKSDFEYSKKHTSRIIVKQFRSKERVETYVSTEKAPKTSRINPKLNTSNFND